MRKLIGFLIGGTVAFLLVRYHILDGGEIQATRYCADAIAQGLWREATKIFGESAALKLAAGVAVGGTLGAAIQYLIERQVHLGRR